MAICLDFDWQTNEFMLYCRTTQLREKTMLSYEQTLRLFEKWCMEEQGIIQRLLAEPDCRSTFCANHKPLPFR